LLPGVAGPAALFMYENSSGQRFTIYCSRLDAGRTAFRYDDSDGIGAVRWIESNYGWVVSGPKDKDRLKSIASAAYDQVENRTPAPSQGEATQLMSRRGS
jgi:anti-sigma factor RsiW